MPPSTDVLELIRRARSGDEAASADLVRRIEPLIQRVIRIRMGPRGRRGPIGHELSSADVCQSILQSLFLGLREDRYRFDRPEDLEKLLRVMIRLRVAAKARRSSVRLRTLFDDFEREGWPDSAPAPEQGVTDQDLVEAILRGFTDVELEILTMWLDGATWADIGLKLGCKADAVRIRTSRALGRVRDRMTEVDGGGARALRRGEDP